jgi:hypothetical protein
VSAIASLLASRRVTLAQPHLRAAYSSLRLQSHVLRSRSGNGIWRGQDSGVSIMVTAPHIINYERRHVLISAQHQNAAFWTKFLTNALQLNITQPKQYPLRMRRLGNTLVRPVKILRSKKSPKLQRLPANMGCTKTAFGADSGK